MQSRLGLLILVIALLLIMLVHLAPLTGHLMPGTVHLVMSGAGFVGVIIAFARSTHELNRDLKKWEQKNRGYCIYCGYDLRATPKRCPECSNWVDDA